MANGYDSHSMKATGLREASSSDMARTGLSVARRDKRFTRSGIGYRTQREASTMDPGAMGQAPPPIMYGDGYPGGTAAHRRGMDESQRPWETAQEATSPQIRPRDTLERSGIMEALPPWLQKKGEDGDDEEKESASGVRENMGSFPCETDARIALAVLSQFVDGDTLDSVQSAIEDQFGDPSEQPDEPPMDMYDDEGDDWMGESADLQEAPLTAKQRDKLPDSAFAGPNRTYPIDTPERARSALARVEAFGSDSEKTRVRSAVKKKYPDMETD